MTPRKEKAVVLVLGFLIAALICTALLAPFVLAVRFGEGWLALNYITVPAYLIFAAWGDLRKTAGRRGRRPLRTCTHGHAILSKQGFACRYGKTFAGRSATDFS